MNRVDREVVDRVEVVEGEVLIEKVFWEDREGVGAKIAIVNWHQFHLATGSIGRANYHLCQSPAKPRLFPHHSCPTLMAKNHYKHPIGSIAGG
jgi:hypothetical protein